MDIAPVDIAGFILVGGRSSRMGRDKARLPASGGCLATRAAEAAANVCGSVNLVGEPLLYGNLGYPVIPDEIGGCGPLAGITAALAVSKAPWNLILACDMPEAGEDFLKRLLEQVSGAGGADAVIPAGPSGQLEPLCAVYHRRCLPVFRIALDRGTRRIAEALKDVNTVIWTVADARPFQNVNTPEEWRAYAAK
ncbi:MAG: molybdenum cofactor guanylyltransferase [Bryobacterales bacterium]|nr:molybdenum cofactor guanylyltransferase [Bryobacterales bacterium]